MDIDSLGTMRATGSEAAGNLPFEPDRGRLTSVDGRGANDRLSLREGGAFFRPVDAWGGAGNESRGALDGSAGDDFLRPGPGIDGIIGGSGFVFVVCRDPGETNSVPIDLGGPGVSPASSRRRESGDTPFAVEGIIGGEGDDTLVPAPNE